MVCCIPGVMLVSSHMVYRIIMMYQLRKSKYLVMQVLFTSEMLMEVMIRSVAAGQSMVLAAVELH